MIAMMTACFFICVGFFGFTVRLIEEKETTRAMAEETEEKNRVLEMINADLMAAFKLCGHKKEEVQKMLGQTLDTEV